MSRWREEGEGEGRRKRYMRKEGIGHRYFVGQSYAFLFVSDCVLLSFPSCCFAVSNAFVLSHSWVHCFRFYFWLESYPLIMSVSVIDDKVTIYSSIG